MIDIEVIRQSTRLVKRLPPEMVSQAQRNVIALLEEVERLRTEILKARRNGSIPEAFWLPK